MPRYFFNVRRGEDVITDDEGAEFSNLDAVKKEAHESAKQLVVNAIEAEREVDHPSFEITDEAGQIVLTLPFRDAAKLD